ncbi:hypothetical protein ACSBR1_000534 [Camellia fascicularis]
MERSSNCCPMASHRSWLRGWLYRSLVCWDSEFRKWSNHYWTLSTIICDSTVSIKTKKKQISLSNHHAVIFINDDPRIHVFNYFYYSGAVITTKEAQAVIKYAEIGFKPKASFKFQQTFVGTKPAPVIAFYSSRGLAPSYPSILKLDVMAPGTLVLATWIPNGFTTGIGLSLNLSSDCISL